MCIGIVFESISLQVLSDYVGWNRELRLSVYKYPE